MSTSANCSSATSSYALNQGATNALSVERTSELYKLLDEASQLERYPKGLPAELTGRISLAGSELCQLASDPQQLPKIARIFQAGWQQAPDKTHKFHQFLQEIRFCLEPQDFMKVTALMAKEDHDNPIQLFKYLIEAEVMNPVTFGSFRTVYPDSDLTYTPENGDSCRTLLCNYVFQHGADRLRYILRSLYPTEKAFRKDIRFNAGVFRVVQQGKTAGLDLMMEILGEEKTVRVLSDLMFEEQNLLDMAASSGRVDVINKVAELFRDVPRYWLFRTCKDCPPTTPLHNAIKSGKPEAVKAVLDYARGLETHDLSKLLTTTSAGRHQWATAIKLATELPDDTILLQVLEELTALRKAGQLNLDDYSQKQLLEMAIASGHATAIPALFKLLDFKRQAPMVWRTSINNDQPACIRALYDLSGPEGLLSTKIRHARAQLNPLQSAAAFGSSAALSTLLEIAAKEGGDLLSKLLEATDGRSLLYYAASGGSAACINMVIKLLAPSTEEIKAQANQLILAAYLKRSVEGAEAIHTLLNTHGIQTELSEQFHGDDALYHALDSNNPKLVSLLAQYLPEEDLRKSLETALPKLSASAYSRHKKAACLLALVPYLDPEIRTLVLAHSLELLLKQWEIGIRLSMAASPSDYLKQNLERNQKGENLLHIAVEVLGMGAVPICGEILQAAGRNLDEALLERDHKGLCPLLRINIREDLKVVSKLYTDHALKQLILAKDPIIARALKFEDLELLKRCLQCLKQLDEKTQIELIQETRVYGNTLLCASMDLEPALTAVLDCFKNAPEPVREALLSYDKDSSPPLHCQRTAAQMNGVLTLMKGLKPEFRKKLLSARYRNNAITHSIEFWRKYAKSFFQELSTDDIVTVLSAEGIIDYYFDHFGNTLHWLLDLDAENLFLPHLKLLDQIPKNAVTQLLSAKIGGKTVLHMAVKNGSVELVSAIFRLLDRAGLKACMGPDKDGNTPLHLAAKQGNPKLFFMTLEAVQHLGGDSQMDSLKENRYEGNLFHLLALAGAHDLLTPCIQHYQRAGLDPLSHSQRANWVADTPLHIALNRGHNSFAKKLIDLIGPKNAAKILLTPCPRGFDCKKVWRSPDSRDILLGLIPHCKDYWAVAAAISKKKSVLYEAESLFLSIRAPERIHLYLSRSFQGNRVWATLDFAMDKHLHEQLETNGIEIDPVLKIGQERSLDPMIPQFPQLIPLLQEQKQALQKRLKDEEDPVLRGQLETGLDTLDYAHMQLCRALVAANADAKQVNALASLLARIPVYGDKPLREALITALARFPLKGQAIEKWASSLSGKQPGLYLIALNALENRGVRPEILEGIHARVNASFKEGTVKGKQLLQTLLALATSTELSTSDLYRLLTPMLYGDLMGLCTAIGQILHMGEAAQLHNAKLKATVQQFELLAIDCFRKHVPMTVSENFSENYQRQISDQRKPHSLLTYASKIRDYPEVLKVLGSCLDALFSNRFQEMRVSSANNPHLAAVYAEAPQLQKRLRELAATMPTFTLDQFSKKETLTEFPVSRKVLHEVIVGDQHLCPNRFKWIHQFLEGDRRASKELQKARKASPNDRDLLLQHQLIAICLRSDALIKAESRNRQQELSALKENIFRCLKSAKRLADEIQAQNANHHIGEFHANLDHFVDTIKKATPSGIDRFQVSITDQFWDLLRIGSDMDGSCQRIDGNSNYNKCLMDYIANGKNIAIVVRQPGNDTIVARRLLKVELNEETGKPVLYLERLYRDHYAKQIDLGIQAMARAVAEELQLPLYTAGQGVPIKIESKQGPAPWAYSDAVRGRARNGVYRFEGAKLL